MHRRYPVAGSGTIVSPDLAAIVIQRSNSWCVMAWPSTVATGSPCARKPAPATARMVKADLIMASHGAVLAMVGTSSVERTGRPAARPAPVQPQRGVDRRHGDNERDDPGTGHDAGGQPPDKRHQDEHDGWIKGPGRRDDGTVDRRCGKAMLSFPRRTVSPWRCT